MKVTVWGGAGFLGSHVCDALSCAGHEVTIADINKSPWKRDDQIMLTGSLEDKATVLESIKGADYVFNFAGIADIDEANAKPFKSAEINILGNLSLLDACVKLKVKRYFFASSLYVYSKSGGFYRCTKQSCENYIEEYHRMFNLSYTILRFGSLYGLRSDEENAIYRFLKEALTTKKINYFGNPDALREYIHAEDAAGICCSMLEEKYENEHVIITGHQSIQVNQLLEMIKEIVDDEIEFNFNTEVDNPHYKITPYNLKTTLAKKYSPNLHIALGDGLLQIMNEIQNQIND